MKRDDDLIRVLLFEAEASEHPWFLVSIHLSSPPEELRRHEHAKLLCDAGFFQEVSEDVFRITNQGHDYLAAIRDEGIWKKTKEAVSATGNVGLGVMKDIAIAYVKQDLSTRLGLSL